ncbi:MAG: hypothetical protein GY749_25305 [Desulfobacteraceae bacterium]|nr:hypothetical protein [Desulfobacteraceae bacterium]
MNKHEEEKSLLKVREWKEKSYQESKNLSEEEYIEKLKTTAQKIMSEYHLHLERVTL